MVAQVHCKNRPLREELYRAFISRASSGEGDNTAIIRSILTLRKEKAGLLGYTCHADVSLASKVRTPPLPASGCLLGTHISDSSRIVGSQCYNLSRKVQMWLNGAGTACARVCSADSASRM